MRFLMVLVLATVLGGCINAAQPHVPENLTGLTEWRLIELDGQKAVAGTLVALSIDMERMKISGSAGCNRFSTKFTDTRDQLEIGPVGLTKRFCKDPKGIMEQERAFVHVLQAVGHLTYDGASLRARGSNGTLVFGRLSDGR